MTASDALRKILNTTSPATLIWTDPILPVSGELRKQAAKENIDFHELDLGLTPFALIAQDASEDPDPLPEPLQPLFKDSLPHPAVLFLKNVDRIDPECREHVRSLVEKRKLFRGEDEEQLAPEVKIVIQSTSPYELQQVLPVEFLVQLPEMNLGYQEAQLSS